MIGEHPVVLVIYLTAVICGVLGLCGIAADYLELRARVRQERKP